MHKRTQASVDKEREGGREDRIKETGTGASILSLAFAFSYLKQSHYLFVPQEEIHYDVL